MRSDPATGPSWPLPHPTPTPTQGLCTGQRNPLSMLRQPSLRDELPRRPLMEPEFPAVIRELSLLDEDTKDIPRVQGAKIPKWDILLSQGQVRAGVTRRLSSTAPLPRAERDPGVPHTPPLMPSCAQSALGPPDWTPFTHLQSRGDRHHPKLPVTASGGSACCRVFLLLKGKEPPHGFCKRALPLTCGELTFWGPRREG